MVTQSRIYTIDEFEDVIAQQPDALLELIDGVVVEKMTSEEHGKIVINIGSELRAWLKRSAAISGHYATEASYRTPDDNHNERRPDVSFRLTDEAVSVEAVAQTMPDFAVEVKSARNGYDELRDKARFYLARGSRLVWLVYPSKRIVEVYFADGSSELFQMGDMLDGGDVLPGFLMAVDEVFDV